MSRRDGPPDSDRFGDHPHPRDNFAFFGHAAAETALAEDYAKGRLPHAILIGGPEGIGKATLAWRLARFVLAHPDGAGTAAGLSVDERHPVARRICAQGHGDLAGLRREWNDKGKKHFTQIRVDEVRKATALFQKAAGEGGWRICIVDSADDLNASSGNALLKIIEEPPPRSLFVLVAHRPGQVMATLRSRCRKLVLGALSEPDIVAALRHAAPSISLAQATAAAARSQGSVREALRLAEGGALPLEAAITRLLAALPAIDWREAHGVIDAAGRSAEDGFDILHGALFAFLAQNVRQGAAERRSPAQLAPWAAAYEALREKTREADALNLDKRALTLSLFAELAQAAKLSRQAAG